METNFSLFDALFDVVCAGDLRVRLFVGITTCVKRLWKPTTVL